MGVFVRRGAAREEELRVLARIGRVSRAESGRASREKEQQRYHNGACLPHKKFPPSRILFTVYFKTRRGSREIQSKEAIKYCKMQYPSSFQSSKNFLIASRVRTRVDEIIQRMWKMRKSSKMLFFYDIFLWIKRSASKKILSFYESRY
jgi:hypothetical protein